MARLICGIWRLDGCEVEPERLGAMVDALRPAGAPWAQELMFDESVAMAVIEIGTPGSTPLAPSLRRTVTGMLAADVRLYDDVRPDEEALARRVSEGPAALATSHGDFAFALWDRSGKSLTLGRDHFGVRPLQFTIRRGEYVAFASLPAALLRTGMASRALDEEVIASFPVNRQPFPGRTFFRDIQSVRAAHLVEIDASGNARSQRYWRLPLEKRLPLDTDPLEAAAEIRRLLDQAVRRRLPPTGPVASHMSGGLDSTPIAVLAARSVRAEGRICLGYSFQEARSSIDAEIVDESPYVAETAESEPNLHVRPISSPSYHSILSEGVDADTMLPLSPNEPEEAVLIDASRAGAGTMLSGWGGDQVVTSFGPGAESELFRACRWSRLARELEQRSRQTGRPPWREFITRVAARQLPPSLNAYYRRLRGLDGWYGRKRFTKPGRQESAIYEVRPRFPDGRATRRAELEAWWIPYRLEMFAQQGARHGIAYAYPMLDLDLLRYAMRLPESLFRRGGIPRRLIRDAIDGLVPESVRWREEKLAPYPVEGLRIAEERERIAHTFRELARMPLVREFIDADAVIACLNSGRTAEQIRARMAEDARCGRQFTSAEEEHEGVMLLAFFLEAQGKHAGSST